MSYVISALRFCGSWLTGLVNSIINGRVIMFHNSTVEFDYRTNSASGNNIERLKISEIIIFTNSNVTFRYSWSLINNFLKTCKIIDFMGKWNGSRKIENGEWLNINYERDKEKWKPCVLTHKDWIIIMEWIKKNGTFCRNELKGNYRWDQFFF